MTDARRRATGVRVDSGPVTPTLFLRDVSQDRWAELVRKRRHYLDAQLFTDCRCLVRFVEEADQMWQALGYRGVEDLVRGGYGLEPEEVALAVRWLELNDPDTPVSLPDAVAKSRAQLTLESAKANPEPIGPHGTNQHGEEVPNSETGTSSRGSNATGYRIRRLRRDHPDVAARLDAGELKSVAAAERAARGLEPHPMRRVPTVVELLRRLWARGTPGEREEFAAGEEGDEIGRLRGKP